MRYGLDEPIIFVKFDIIYFSSKWKVSMVNKIREKIHRKMTLALRYHFDGIKFVTDCWKSRKEKGKVIESPTQNVLIHVKFKPCIELQTKAINKRKRRCSTINECLVIESVKTHCQVHLIDLFGITQSNALTERGRQEYTLLT